MSNIPKRVIDAVQKVQRQGITSNDRTRFLEAVHNVDESARDWLYINWEDVDVVSLLAHGSWLND